VAARFRQKAGYSMPAEQLHRAAVHAPPPKRCAKVAEVRAAALPKQLVLLGDK